MNHLFPLGDSGAIILATAILAACIVWAFVFTGGGDQ